MEMSSDKIPGTVEDEFLDALDVLWRQHGNDDPGYKAMLPFGKKIAELQAKVNRLIELSSVCYTGLGAECDLPEAWLDALSQAAYGKEFSTDGLLPFISTQRQDAEKWRRYNSVNELPIGERIESHVLVGVNVWRGDKWLGYHETTTEEWDLAFSKATKTEGE